MGHRFCSVCGTKYSVCETIQSYNPLTGVPIITFSGQCPNAVDENNLFKAFSKAGREHHDRYVNGNNMNICCD